MQVHNKLIKYKAYIQLSEKHKKKRIDQAEQEKQSKNNPQHHYQFPETNFLYFTVNQNGQKIKLTTYRYPAKEEPQAIVIIFHGLNSHIGHAAHIALALADINITSVGFDHRGFGRSQGISGKVNSFDEHINDSLRFVQLVRQMYKGLPLFLLGLSMGGMTSYYLSLKHAQLFQGAILMAPALKSNNSEAVVTISNVLKTILPQNSKLFKPVYGIGSRNPKVTQDIKVDPYAYKQRMRTSTINFLMNIMSKSPQTFSNYNSPFMIVQGGLDKLVNPDVAFELFTKSKTHVDDKQILFYQNMWHDIWHQEQITEIMQKVIIWIYQRLKIRKNKANKNEQK